MSSSVCEGRLIVYKDAKRGEGYLRCLITHRASAGIFAMAQRNDECASESFADCERSWQSSASTSTSPLSEHSQPLRPWRTTKSALIACCASSRSMFAASIPCPSRYSSRPPSSPIHSLRRHSVYCASHHWGSCGPSAISSLTKTFLVMVPGPLHYPVPLAFPRALTQRYLKCLIPSTYVHICIRYSFVSYPRLFLGISTFPAQF